MSSILVGVVWFFSIGAATYILAVRRAAPEFLSKNREAHASSNCVECCFHVAKGDCRCSFTAIRVIAWLRGHFGHFWDSCPCRISKWQQKESRVNANFKLQFRSDIAFVIWPSLISLGFFLLTLFSERTSS